MRTRRPRRRPELPPDLSVFLGWVLGLYLIAHLAIHDCRRRRHHAPPLVGLLNSIGFVTIAPRPRPRASGSLGRRRVGVRRHVDPRRDAACCSAFHSCCGLGFLLLPLAGIGRTISSAVVGVDRPAGFQPVEIAQVLVCSSPPTW
jgi:hypothetical protein